jgi:hypothetical protein
MSDAPAGGELETMRMARLGHGSCARLVRTSRRAGAASSILRVNFMAHPLKSLIGLATVTGREKQVWDHCPGLAIGFCN